MTHTLFSSLEPLESRIAPASVVFTDPTDPSKSATLSSSVGTADDLRALITSASEQVSPTIVFSVSLSLAGHAKFAHADFSLIGAGGAAVILNTLDASGFDLGTVTVRGDLDHLVAGDSNLLTSAVKKLDVDSLGSTTFAASVVHGSIGTLNITGDLSGTLTLETRFGSIGTATIGSPDADNGSDAANVGSLFVGGSIGTLTVDQLEGSVGAKSGSILVKGSIAHVTIGDLYGGTGTLSGSLQAEGNLPDVKITGGIHGNTDPTSHASNGSITAFGKIGSITVTGTVEGGAAVGSGDIAAGAGIGTAVLTGGLAGGAGVESGAIGSFGPIGSVTLGETGGTTDIMVGGPGAKSGSVLGSTTIYSVTVNGNILGGDGASSAEIASAGTLHTVLVHGNVTGGNLGAGSGAIGSTGALGDVTVDGALTGGSADSSGQIVSATSIHSVKVHGSVQGGLGAESGAIGSLGSIGTVAVDSDVIGGGAFHSGSIVTAKSIGIVTIGGSLKGSDSSENSGADGVVFAGSAIGSITVTQDVVGGVLSGSGSIVADFLPSVTIHGSIIGGDADHSGAVAGRLYIGRVMVDGDIQAGLNDYSGVVYTQGSIASVAVGGSLLGFNSDGFGDFSGSIIAQSPLTELARVAASSPVLNNIGTVTIGGEMQGGNGDVTGSVFAQGTVSSVMVGTQLNFASHPLHAAEVSIISKGTGNLSGGEGTLSGSIVGNHGIGTVQVFGGMLGGGGQLSGTVHSNGPIGTVSFSLSVTGGAGPSSGAITGASIVSVNIGADLTGGLGDHAGSIIAFGTDIGKVTVGGTIGVAPGSASSTYISAQRNLGSLEAGDIAGQQSVGSAATANVDVFITAGGNLLARSAAQALAIGAVTVHRTMSYTTIEAGYDSVLNQVNGHVLIGTIDVGKDAAAAAISTVWTENDVIAGANGTTIDSTEIKGGNTAILSEVVKVIIRGNMGGSKGSHEVIADLIGSATAGAAPGTLLTLSAGPHNDYISFDPPIDPQSDTIFHEIGVRLT